jgi:hypothetical protein
MDGDLEAFAKSLKKHNVIRAGGGQVCQPQSCLICHPPCFYPRFTTFLDSSQLRALPPHCASQGGVSKAFSSPNPMFIPTGVQLTVS